MRHFFLFVLFTVAACAGYDVTLNEKVVYSPPQLFADFEFADPSLQSCVQQSIKDQRLTAANQLTRLVCTSGNIQSLEGIEIFSSLRQLKLSANSLRNIDALASLPALQTLSLAENRLQSVRALLGNTELVRLDLKKNPDLECAGVVELMNRNPALRVDLPDHCTSAEARQISTPIRSHACVSLAWRWDDH